MLNAKCQNEHSWTLLNANRNRLYLVQLIIDYWLLIMKRPSEMRLHVRLGQHCVDLYINGKPSLLYQLQQSWIGNWVEILPTKHSHRKNLKKHQPSWSAWTPSKWLVAQNKHRNHNGSTYHRWAQTICKGLDISDSVPGWGEFLLTFTIFGPKKKLWYKRMCNAACHKC